MKEFKSIEANNTESFICNHLSEITGKQYILKGRTADENITEFMQKLEERKADGQDIINHIGKIAGCDIYAIRCNETITPIMMKYEYYISQIECKGNRQYLYYENPHAYGDDASGTIRCELWKEGSSEYGWMMEYIYPDIKNNIPAEERDTMVMEPTEIVFPLYADSMGKDIFCVICFDWERFVEKANELSMKSFYPAIKIPTKTKADDWKWKASHHVVGREMHFRLADLMSTEPRIMMVRELTDEDMIRILANGKQEVTNHKLELMRNRMKYLSEHATGWIGSA